MSARAVIFDLDGTLIHSAPDLQAAANVALADLGREPVDLATVVSFIGNGVEKLVTRCLDHTGGASNDEQAAALAAFMTSYNANMTRLTRPYPGVVDCLAELRAEGRALGICTNKPTGPARDICKALSIDHFFDAILGAEPGRAKKPDPASLLACAERLGAAPSEVLYVGDSAVDYETAQNAGIAFHFFTGGYLNSKLPAIPETHKFDHWAAHGIPSALIST